MPKYRAFISCRHRPLDIAAAKPVQAKLETFTLRIPPIEETIAAVREIAREYEFLQADRLKYYLD